MATLGAIHQAVISRLALGTFVGQRSVEAFVTSLRILVVFALPASTSVERDAKGLGSAKLFLRHGKSCIGSFALQILSCFLHWRIGWLGLNSSQLFFAIDHPEFELSLLKGFLPTKASLGSTALQP